MSVEANLSFGATFRSLWNGMVEVVVRLPLLLLGGGLVFLAIGGVQSGLAADNMVLREALDVLATILILPVEIAIYRLLILGEASAVGWASSAPRFARMLGWTIVLWALMTVPNYLTDLTSSAIANVIATVLVVVIVVVLYVRISILFPAIATDASGASLGNTWADTRGRVWLIFKTYIIVTLPLLALVVVTGLIRDRIGVPGWMDVAGDNVLEYLATIAFAVASSRLFDWIGHQVKGLPPEPGAAELARRAPSVG